MMVEHIERARDFDVSPDPANNRPSRPNGRGEISSLVRTIQNYGLSQSPLYPESRLNKTCIPQHYRSKQIERILQELHFFQGTHALRRNVEQAIVSIVSALKAAIDKFDKEKNLRDIKKRRYQAGSNVEKTNKSKQT